MPPATESCGMRPQKITFGEMRASGGPTGILVYCADYRCSHSMEMSADQWPDDVRLSDIEPRFGLWKARRRRSADFQRARMGTRMELLMGNWTPSIVPSGDSETVYLVLDDFGDLGRCWRETDIETAVRLVTLRGQQAFRPLTIF